MRYAALLLLGAASTIAFTPPKRAQSRAPTAREDSLVVRGRRTFDAICSGCHSLEPPPLKAPPMAMIAARYRAATRGRAQLIERLAAWPPQPDPERSLLPPMMLRHWGLMPAIPLPGEDLNAVGHFLASVAYDSLGGGMRRMGHMGMGMRPGGRGVMRPRPDTLSRP